jgi:hypothetical protein
MGLYGFLWDNMEKYMKSMVLDGFSPKNLIISMGCDVIH